jgi:hypothetical protein
MGIIVICILNNLYFNKLPDLKSVIELNQANKTLK